MVLLHPVCLAVSPTGALVYDGELGGRRALAGHLRFALPVLLLAVGWVAWVPALVLLLAALRQLVDAHFP